MLKPDDFTAFFRDVHGYEPFPWQKRLTEQVLSKEFCSWPRVLDLPTGTGKTAVLDTAVFTMAIRPDSCPRRVVFVVDRRIVVDQVYERAESIKERIESADTEVLRTVREQLRKLSDGESLGVTALRGGIPIDNGWASSPDKPWIIVSTVDQFGSRLLFRGYGVRHSMRPVHAGLAGNDCLVILDEVHLSSPFAETLNGVSKLKCRFIPRRFSIVEMSATPSNSNATRFTLDGTADLKKCDELRQRVQAVKKAELLTVQNTDSIPSTALRKVKSIDKAGKDRKNVRSIGIIVNRVRTARETYGALKEAGFHTFMLTGRMRPLDRLDILNSVSGKIDPDAEEHDNSLTILVATQSIEVGADFSFDALITECAPVDSLRQRFGRLDRRGKNFARTGIPARAWIMGPRSVVKSKKPDPIYGDSIKATWERLNSLLDNQKEIDVGPLSLQNFPEETVAPRISAPLLLRSYMDAWVQTNPEPSVQPPLEWFLHGMNIKHDADVYILWRWDISSEALSLVPPRSAEFLQIPVNVAKSWLKNGLEVDVADVDSFAENKDSPDQMESDIIGDCVRWEGFAEEPKQIHVEHIRPGDILILKPSRGGIAGGTWDPSSVESIADLGDAAQLEHGKRATLRLDSRIFPNLMSMPNPENASIEDYHVRDKITELLSELREASEYAEAWAVQAAGRLITNDFEITQVGLDNKNEAYCYYVLSERIPTERIDPETMDGSDESGAFTGTGVLLKDHLCNVGKRAMQIAQRLGCSAEIVEDLHLAGQLHDIGKVDRRFQNQLVGDDPVNFEMLDQPLAKSLPGISRVNTYPKGMRHEIASLAMVKSSSNILAKANDPDLVLHLIGTHHGWGRPLLPIIKDSEPQKLSYKIDGYFLGEVSSDFVESSLALDMADCFWRLIERYGYYGLAWLEAILRLADHQQSAQEQLQ